MCHIKTLHYTLSPCSSLVIALTEINQHPRHPFNALNNFLLPFNTLNTARASTFCSPAAALPLSKRLIFPINILDTARTSSTYCTLSTPSTPLSTFDTLDTFCFHLKHAQHRTHQQHLLPPFDTLNTPSTYATPSAALQHAHKHYFQHSRYLLFPRKLRQISRCPPPPRLSLHRRPGRRRCLAGRRLGFF